MRQESWRPTIIFVIFAILAGLLISYAPQLIYRFIVPIGGDSFSHLQTVIELTDGNLAGAIHRYPPLFHSFPALLSSLTNLSPIQGLVWFNPILLFLSALSLAYVVGRWLKSWPAVFIVFGFGLLIALQPFQIWQDGGYPNVLASYVFLPIGLWSLAKLAYDEQDKTALPIYLLVGALIFLTHHLTTITYFLISFVFLVLRFINAYLRKEELSGHLKTVGWAVLALVSLGVLSIPFGFAGRLFKLVFAFNSHFPFIEFARGLDSQFAILDIAEIPFSIGWELAVLGGLGLVLLWLDREIKWQIKLFFSAWVLTLVALSQIKGLVFPIRFARELGAPLTILAGFATIKVFQNLPTLLRLVWVPLILVLVVSGTTTKVKKVMELPQRIEFTEYDLAASHFLDFADNEACAYVVPRSRYYQYFTSIEIKSYALIAAVRKDFDRLVADEDPQFAGACRYTVAERIPGEFDWAGNLEQKGFIPEASFDGETRGAKVFLTNEALYESEDE
ncbi:hypothetical protein KC644_03775 [Candidatus Berkelbacteria bacterium]|nr:hypothetical protein [Candidatus Berkelbacteria bacterium]